MNIYQIICLVVIEICLLLISFACGAKVGLKQGKDIFDK